MADTTATTASSSQPSAVTSADYAKNGNDASQVKLIKNYALFLYAPDEQFAEPTGLDWTPGSKKPIGYSSEDGAVLHPEPGDNTDFTAHNGDIVLSVTEPGYWTLQLAGIESRKEVIEAYFDADVASDGSLSVTGAGMTKTWKLVLAALDQEDRPMLLYAKNAQVSDRDDVSMKKDELMQYSITFKMLKDTSGIQWKAFGFVTSE